MATVSVIVPNYNHAKYLVKRIDSILEQKDIELHELILLDDASTDNSIEILSSYLALPNVKMVKNESNSGSTFKQWQRGLSMATGDYVWIAESDDYSSPTFLRTLINGLEKVENAGIAFCRSVLVDENDLSLSKSSVLPPFKEGSVWNTSFEMNGVAFLTSFMLQRNVIPNVSSVLFRKKVVDQMSGFYTKFRLSGDWLLYSHVLLESNLLFFDMPLNYFRVHANTVRKSTQKSELALVEHLKVYKEIMQHVNPGFAVKWRAEKSFVAKFGSYFSVLDLKTIFKIWSIAVKSSWSILLLVPYWCVFVVAKRKMTS